MCIIDSDFCSCTKVAKACEFDQSIESSKLNLEISVMRVNPARERASCPTRGLGSSRASGSTSSKVGTGGDRLPSMLLFLLYLVVYESTHLPNIQQHCRPLPISFDLSVLNVALKNPFRLDGPP